MPFPTQDELEESDLDLIVSGSKDAVLMIEGFAREMPEDLMLEAIREAHQHHQASFATCSGAGRQGRRRRRRNTRSRPTTASTTGSRSRYYDELQVGQADHGKQARAEAVSASRSRSSPR